MKRIGTTLSFLALIASIVLSACGSVTSAPTQAPGCNYGDAIAVEAQIIYFNGDPKVCTLDEYGNSSWVNLADYVADMTPAPTATATPTVAAASPTYGTPTATVAAASPTAVTTDDNVVTTFGGRFFKDGDDNSGHEMIWEFHKSWLTTPGGYGLQGNMLATFCGNNGVNIPENAECRKAMQTWISEWNPDVGIDFEACNDGGCPQYVKVGSRLYHFSWDATVPPNQISNLYWTGNSFIACQNDTGPLGKFGGEDVGPCYEMTDWVEWDKAGTLEGFAPYLDAYNQLTSLPTSSMLIAHGNPILIYTFDKPKQ